MELKKVLEQAFAPGVSDLHLSIGAPPMIRLHGQLCALNAKPLTVEEISTCVSGLLEERPQLLEDLQHKGEIDFAYTLPAIGRSRVNVYRQRGSFAVALRLLQLEVPDMSVLGLPIKTLEDLTRHRGGLVLVTGPTGSGKSTTLAAMLRYINTTQRAHILTLEDPIEYIHPHINCLVNQREMGTDSESYATALRSALREDPDVILVGEMRDLETIQIAITAAETGHLVLSSLHTLGVADTIDRIVDVFPARQQAQIRLQLAHTLLGILSQQLLRGRDGQSRHVALEVMVKTSAISNLVREGKTHQIYSQLQTGSQ